MIHYNPVFVILGLGTPELVLIAFVILVFFGGNKIPELMRGLGRGVKEFNSARSNVEDEIRKGMDEEHKK
jgi:sec-independent protein translocase protein TatA